MSESLIFPGNKSIDNYININDNLPENSLEIIDKRISYLKENNETEKIKEELSYLASIGSVGWWYWHDIRDHHAKTEDEINKCSDNIKRFGAIEAYITTNAAQEESIKAAEYLLLAATAHDKAEDEKNRNNEEIWNTYVVPNLKRYFESCGLRKDTGIFRSQWWLEHHRHDYDKVADAYIKELKNITNTAIKKDASEKK